MRDSTGGENSVLNKVLAEYMLRIDQGEPANRDGFISAHPGIADGLRAHFAAEDALQRVLAESSVGGSSSECLTTLAFPAENADKRTANVEAGQVFGDYELLGPIGRGGMGVVFKARQRSLNRLVAVKMISSRILNDRLRIERFSREAEAAGNLRHPHIVMVHEAGNYAGQHYYSMDYIEGGSLAEIIRANPMSGRRAAGYLCKVAEAIHYAHGQGTLHRDIKPANILIDIHDEPHVADFGLAKKLDVDSTLTAECAVGSPAYMPPEQIDHRCGEVGPASDVYGLGATLYDLLTGRPPFRSETPMATYQQVLHAEPVAPRLLNADIHRDLETICLKCLAKEPARRYASAEALADDLHRYLRNEPIHARPAGASERLWRWCRRSPLVASLIGATALSLVLGLAAASIGYFRATKEQQRAERNLGHATGVVQEFCRSISENRLLNEPGMQELRKELLEKAQTYFQNFVDENKESGATPTLLAELALSHYQLANITEELGDSDTKAIVKALVKYMKADQLQKALLRDSPQDIGLLVAHGDTVNAIGRCWHRLGNFDRANEAFNKALEGRKFDRANEAYEKALEERELVVGSSDSDKAALLLANTYMNLGLLAKDRCLASGMSPEENQWITWIERARTHIENAQRIRLGLPEPVRSALMVQHDIAHGNYNRALVDLADKNIPEAEKSWKLAAVGFSELEREHPEDLDIRYDYALCDRVGVDIQCLKDPSGAIPDLYDNVLKRIKELAEENPAMPKYRVELADIYVKIGQSMKEQDEIEESEQSFEQARSILTQLVSVSEANISYRRSLVKVLREITVLQYTEDSPSLLDTLRELRQQWLQLTQLVPDDPVLVEEVKSTDEAIALAEEGQARL